MKKLYLVTIALLFFIQGFCQVLLEDKSGDPIVTDVSSVANATVNNTANIKLNTGDQSIGFNYFTSTRLNNPNKYKIHDFTIKAKPTEGYAAVIKNQKFSPGVRLSYAFTQVRLLTPDASGSIDWGGLTVNYDINKYSLFRADTTFKEQLYSKNLSALSFQFNYNLLVRSKFIATIRLGYSRKSNHDDLKSIEIKDIVEIFDAVTQTTRQQVKTQSVKTGKYEEFDAYPLVISFTKATQTDPAGSTMAQSLRLGYSIYLKNVASNDLPQTSIGTALFLTKQNKNGVRAPVFGLVIQANDPFDVQKQNNGLQSRIELGITSVINL